MRTKRILVIVSNLMKEPFVREYGGLQDSEIVKYSFITPAKRLLDGVVTDKVLIESNMYGDRALEIADIVLRGSKDIKLFFITRDDEIVYFDLPDRG